MSTTMIAERGSSTVLSASVTVPDGARAALLHAPGLFRLDVQSQGDTLRTTVRNLGGGSATVSGPGYAGPVAVETYHADLAPSRYDLTVDIQNGTEKHAARVLVAALRDRAAGVTTFTAQAVLDSA